MGNLLLVLYQSLRILAISLRVYQAHQEKDLSKKELSRKRKVYQEKKRKRQVYQEKDFSLRNVKSRNWYLKFLKLESSLTQHRRFRRQNPPSSVTVKYSVARSQHSAARSTITVDLELINLRIS